jgi:hypothetical protein
VARLAVGYPTAVHLAEDSRHCLGDFLKVGCRHRHSAEDSGFRGLCHRRLHHPNLPFQEAIPFLSLPRGHRSRPATTAARSALAQASCRLPQERPQRQKPASGRKQSYCSTQPGRLQAHRRQTPAREESLHESSSDAPDVQAAPVSVAVAASAWSYPPVCDAHNDATGGGQHLLVSPGRSEQADPDTRRSTARNPWRHAPAHSLQQKQRPGEEPKQ